MAKLHTTSTQWSVPASMTGWRFDRTMATLLVAMSRSQARAVIEAGQACLDGETIVNPRYSVASGQMLRATYVPSTPAEQLVAQDIELDIVTETDEYIVVNKPVGLVVHPGNGHATGTLGNALVAHSAACATLPRGGLVHRLDKDTSGLLVVAKTEGMRLTLLEQFKHRTVSRIYLAIVHGIPVPTGMIDQPIGRNKANRVKMAISASGRPALTRWRVMKTSKVFALLQCELESGRTHQIRVHMERLGHPLVGDRTYRNYARAEGGRFARQMLHAWTLSFVPPSADTECVFKQAPPADFIAAQRELGLQDD